MRETAIKLLAGVTANTTGPASPQLSSNARTYQAAIAGTGAVAGSVQIQGSNDATNWINVGSALALSGTGSDTKGFASTENWLQVRAVLTGLSGTGAAVSVNMNI